MYTAGAWGANRLDRQQRADGELDLGAFTATRAALETCPPETGLPRHLTERSEVRGSPRTEAGSCRLEETTCDKEMNGGGVTIELPGLVTCRFNRANRAFTEGDP